MAKRIGMVNRVRREHAEQYKQLHTDENRNRSRAKTDRLRFDFSGEIPVAFAPSEFTQRFSGGHLFYLSTIGPSEPGGPII